MRCIIGETYIGRMNNDELWTYKRFRQIRNDKIFSVITDGASNTIEIWL